MDQKREIIHVVNHEGRWLVQREGANGTISRHGAKEQAVRAGCAKAKQGPLSRVVVHRSDGSVESELDYGRTA